VYKNNFNLLQTMQNNLNTSNPNHYIYETKHLKIQILGGIKFNNLEAMRVTLGIQKQGKEQVLRQNIDLYNDTSIEKLTRKVAERLEIGTTIVRRDLDQLTNELENYRLQEVEQQGKQYEKQVKVLTEKEIKEAKSFLSNQNLIPNTQENIGKSGVIGEEINRLMMYLIFTSRKTNNPLQCISLGSSGAGKTHLQSKVSELIPEEDKIEMTVLSPNAFYYFNRTELRNKLILIEDLDGAESVLYPLRELQSKKKITKTVVHKDQKGVTKTMHLTVEGPISVAGCTTQESIYEDNSNRSFLLHIDESHEQDEKIMQYQRQLSAGKINHTEELQAKILLQNAQRLLKVITIKNPFAEFLTLPASVFKPRRTNAHYLQFIEAITFYKQHQKFHHIDKETGEEYIETSIEDIQEANELIKEVLLRKSDSLTGACRNHLENLKEYLKKQNQTQFTNAEIRRNLRVKETTLRRYNNQLLLENYIKKIQNKTTKSYAYEITNPKEYQDLKALIDKALQDCMTQIQRATTPITNQSKVARLKPTKSIS
jgi:predicted transcriptional regulator/translation initiation factor 1 (eIF-1/SUI1)